MLVEINGLSQGSIEVNLQIIPRVGETVKVLYGPDAEIIGSVVSVNHYINQHDGEQKISLNIKEIYE